MRCCEDRESDEELRDEHDCVRKVREERIIVGEIE